MERKGRLEKGREVERRVGLGDRERERERRDKECISTSYSPNAHNSCD